MLSRVNYANELAKLNLQMVYKYKMMHFTYLPCLASCYLTIVQLIDFFFLLHEKSGILRIHRGKIEQRQHLTVIGVLE